MKHIDVVNGKLIMNRSVGSLV